VRDRNHDSQESVQRNEVNEDRSQSGVMDSPVLIAAASAKALRDTPKNLKKKKSKAYG